MQIPAALAWWSEKRGGADWLERMPVVAAECAERWSLELGTPFEGGAMALTVPAERRDGVRAVLKVGFPDGGTEAEGDALAFWDGDGVVRLLARDVERSALLLERCEPGTTLSSLTDEDEAHRIAAGLLRRLWRPPPPGHGFLPLHVQAARWRTQLRRDWEELGRPFERALLEAALAVLEDAAGRDDEAVVLHHDFHAGNVLRAEREPWLVIDPQPLVGDRTFDAASLLRGRPWVLGRPDATRLLRRRLDLLVSELDLERDRLRRFGVVHALVWGVSRKKLEPDMVECARILSSLR